MTAIKNAFEAAFRDYVVTGMAASGRHDPLKADIRAIGTLLQDAVDDVDVKSPNVRNENYIAQRSDVGKFIHHTADAAHAWTLPSDDDDMFPEGSRLLLVNDSASSDVRLFADHGSIRHGADLANSFAIGPYGSVDMLKLSTGLWRVLSAHALTARYDPMTLFLNGEKGAWFDPSDLSTLWQDAAGTIPVTGAGQVVGRMLDKSGNGHHATQATAASKPILGRMPATGARNLLTMTDFPNGTSDGLLRGDVTNSAMEGFGGALAFGELTGSQSYFYKRGNTDAATYTFSAFVRMDDGAAPAFSLSSVIATDFVIIMNGSGAPVGAYEVSHIGDGLYRVSVSGAQPAGTNAVFGVTKYETHSNRTFVVSGYQLERGAVATPYQKVGSAWDVTESGVDSVYYLAFDGVDDVLTTPSINLTHTSQMALFTGLRKLSDAVEAKVIEFSANNVSSNGSFALYAPGLSGPRLDFANRGTSRAVVTVSSAQYAAPSSWVVTGLGDIPTDQTIARFNGLQRPTVTSDLGSGPYGNHPLYLTRQNFNGLIFGVILLDRQPSTDLIQATESWLAAKTGVTF